MHGATEGATPVRWETSTYYIQPAVGDWVDVVHGDTGECRRLTGLELATAGKGVTYATYPLDLARFIWKHGETLEARAPAG